MKGKVEGVGRGKKEGSVPSFTFLVSAVVVRTFLLVEIFSSYFYRVLTERGIISFIQDGKMMLVLVAAHRNFLRTKFT